MTAVGWLVQPAAFPWVALVFGLCIGSFLNVVIHRLPKMLEREWRAECAELAGKEGMGYGDFKMNAAVGAFLGWKMLPLVILLLSLIHI